MITEPIFLVTGESVLSSVQAFAVLIRGCIPFVESILRATPECESYRSALNQLSDLRSRIEELAQVAPIVLFDLPAQLLMPSMAIMSVSAENNGMTPDERQLKLLQLRRQFTGDIAETDKDVPVIDFSAIADHLGRMFEKNAATLVTAARSQFVAATLSASEISRKRSDYLCWAGILASDAESLPDESMLELLVQAPEAPLHPSPEMLAALQELPPTNFAIGTFENGVHRDYIREASRKGFTSVREMLAFLFARRQR